ncbi:MAG: hypothetical protein HY722_10815 [Planctomycetes bacterium]|nr:hypothetical protein [Planctomycetota bacterium]
MGCRGWRRAVERDAAGEPERPAAHAALEAHLALCARCRAGRLDAVALADAFADLRDRPVPPGLVGRIAFAVRREAARREAARREARRWVAASTAAAVVAWAAVTWTLARGGPAPAGSDIAVGGATPVQELVLAGAELPEDIALRLAFHDR